MASLAAVMILGKYGRASNGNGAAEPFGDLLSQMYFAAAHLHRRQKMAVRQSVVPFACAADADVVFDNVVIGRKILVRDWPVLSVAVVTGSLEIQIAQPVALTAPHQSAATDDTQALPGERLIGRRAVRVFQIIYEPIVVVLHARVALPLNRARFQPFERHVPVFQLERRHVLGKLFW